MGEWLLMGLAVIRWRSRASPESSVPKLELGNEGKEIFLV
jgi:hypothetical protein